MPVGGTDGQVLTKQTAKDYDVAWEDAAAGNTRGLSLFKAVIGVDATVTLNAPASLTVLACQVQADVYAKDGYGSVYCSVLNGIFIS